MTTDFFMITAAQVKAARALLAWTQPDLAQASGVPLDTLKRAEAKGLENCNVSTVKKIVDAFRQAGIVFTANGVDRRGAGEGG